MALGKQLPIRLDEHTERRLEAAAQKAGTTKSAIIRLLAQSFVDQVVKAGQVILPPNWSDLLPKADERAAKTRRDRETFVHAVSLNDAPSEAPLPPRKPVIYAAKKRSKKKP
jgi:hypothetical protein